MVEGLLETSEDQDDDRDSDKGQPVALADEGSSHRSMHQPMCRQQKQRGGDSQPTDSAMVGWLGWLGGPTILPTMMVGRAVHIYIYIYIYVPPAHPTIQSNLSLFFTTKPPNRYWVAAGRPKVVARLFDGRPDCDPRGV